MRLFLFILAGLGVLIAAAPADATPACLACHSAPTLGKARVTMESLAGSVHANVQCNSCHTGMPKEAVPHPIPAPKATCLSCHGDPPKMGAKPMDPVKHGKAGAPAQLLPSCASCHGSHNIKPVSSDKSPVGPDKVVEMCATCHGPNGQAAKLIGSAQVVEYKKSVHAKPNPNNPSRSAAVCTDCHGRHTILPESDPVSTVNKFRVPETCGKCHAKELADFRNSSHYQSLAKGEKDAPSCTDCHGEHKIIGAKDPTSPVSTLKVPETCAKCHADMTLVRRFNMPVGKVESYKKSYHGVANRYGEIRVASCSSCHGAHSILPQSDPNSTIHAANLPKTCGTPDCHPGASLNFAKGNMHVAPSPHSDRPVFYVTLIYIMLLWGIIGSFVVMIAGDLVQHFRHSNTEHAKTVEPVDEKEVPRFTRNQLMQHWVLIFSFTALVITGLPIRFADAAPSEWMINLLGGVTMRGAVHRIAAIGLIGVCIWHLIWTFGTKQGRRDLIAMLPEKKDFGRAIGMVKFYFGLQREMPGFGRFNLIEKFEYLAMGWGSLVMIVTGIALWKPTMALKIMPKWCLDIFYVIHSYEAMLAFLAITIWHFYHAHFKPSTFPMNRTWLTGTMKLGDLKAEHREEYDRLLAEMQAEQPASPETEAKQTTAEETQPESDKGQTETPEESPEDDNSSEN